VDDALTVAGVVAVVWPAPTALALVLVIGIRAAVGGLVEIVNGLGSGETAPVLALLPSPPRLPGQEANA
jgi:uncharacterized membrane protein HdeD (DUF308 family)